MITCNEQKDSRVCLDRSMNDSDIVFFGRWPSRIILGVLIVTIVFLTPWNPIISHFTSVLFLDG